jgi:CheY-like chemotaxis protein
MADDDSNLRVMVADDEPKLRALVIECVRSMGCEVVEARDGEEAWELAQREPLDVVVLDVMMPGMSGWEVCRRIKAGSLGPKVLMLTGIGEHLNEMTSPLFAADAWIDKPFELDALRRKIAELGRARRDEQSREESGWVEVPPPAPSGPSLVKARIAEPEQGSESESAEPAPGRPAAAKVKKAPAPKKPKQAKKPEEPKKRKKPKKAPGKKVLTKAPPPKGAAKRGGKTRPGSKKAAAKAKPKLTGRKARRRARRKG